MIDSDTLVFLYITDTHWGANRKRSSWLFKKIINKCKINLIVFGGDFITHSSENREEMIKLGQDFIKCFRTEESIFLPIMGNHDDNSYEQKREKSILAISEIEKIFEIESKTNIHYYKNISYYFDINKKRSRFILLNTSKKEYIKSQLEFINKTLVETPSNYEIIIISHIWLEWNFEKKSYEAKPHILKLFKIFDSYNKRLRTEQYDFKKCDSQIVLLLGGHIHNDYVTKTDGGIPIILCDCDSNEKTFNKYKPIKGLPSEQCLNALFVKRERTIENKPTYSVLLERIGRGENIKLLYEL